MSASRSPRARSRIFLDRPLLGVGLGTLPQAMVVPEPGFDAQQAAHVVLLDVAAETGVVGAACYLVLLVAPWVALVRARTRWTPALVAASGVLAAVTTVGFFDHYTWTTPAGLIWVAIALGLWAAAYRAAAEWRGRPCLTSSWCRSSPSTSRSWRSSSGTR